MAVCVLVWLGFASLAYLFLTDNFSMAYVVEHSNRTLPTFFKIPAIWAGQQGSLLFWSFLLSIYVFSALFVYRHKHPELMPYVGVVLAGVQLFFLTLNNFVASPFQVLGAPGSKRRAAMDFARRWTRPQSAAAVSGNGDSSADPVLRLHGLRDSFRLRSGRFAGPLSRREVDSPHPPLDHDRLGFSGRRAFCWARTGPTPCSDGAATGPGTRSRTRR